jgi:regulator of replication initiation timing
MRDNELLKQQKMELWHILSEREHEIQRYNSSLNYTVANLEKEIKTTIDKNNVLKLKIKKSRNFLQTLSKIISEAVSYEEQELYKH